MMGLELGMSPAARARMSIEPEKPSDPMEMLIGRDGDPNGAWTN